MARGNVVVDRSTEKPWYAQIARQVRARISSGDLKPGSPLSPATTKGGDVEEGDRHRIGDILLFLTKIEVGHITFSHNAVSEER